jgi:hypothetical protein
MGACGRRRMVAEYDIAKLVRLHEAMYEAMLAEPR